MKTNLLVALKNIVENPITNLVSFYSSRNRMNSVGEALELYVKDVFCNSINEDDISKKNEIFSEYFSYIGNQNNPPDIIIKEGDAIEVKKLETINSALALNSSYPKDKLYSDSPMITRECKECENWREKDIIYTVGVTKENKLKSLWFVYGDCYAANKDTYERIRNKISSGLRELQDIELAETNELGRVNKVDPLGITYLRIRGMWHIENPNKVFNYVADSNSSDFVVNALVLEDKYNSFPASDRNNIEQINKDGFSISKVKIKSPNNPAKLLDARLITFKI
jgi:hypothetical protein